MKPDIYKYYSGNKALTYDKDRKNGFIKKLKWKREFLVLSKILNNLERGSSILDTPCGTGRFFPLMQNQFNLYGVDISSDMINNIPQSVLDKNINLCVGQIGRLPFSDYTFDYILCMRFINIIPPNEVFSMITDLCRVAKRGIIIQIRFDKYLFNKILRCYQVVNKILKNRDKFGNTRETIKLYPHKDQFKRFIDSLGFKFICSFPVFSRIDSQRLCYLERKTT